MSDAVAKKTYRKIDPQEQAKFLAASRGGDQDAFSQLAEPHRLELMTHCYRVLGSIEDAEDQVQETFLRAWRRLETYQERASFRAWLYKIATNACLDAMQRQPKRMLPLELPGPSDPSAPLPAPILDPVWIEPYPDEWIAPAVSNPEARYDSYESVSLAFLAALQVLPPRQRIVLILADVMDWPMGEIADTLQTTISSVTSLLHRARLTMKQRRIPEGKDMARMKMPVDQTRELLDRYVRAWESADIKGIISLLSDTATFPMPPLPFWVQGKQAVSELLSREILAGEGRGRFKLVPLHANGQSGFAFYMVDQATRTYHAYALQIITIEGGLVSDVTTFGMPALFGQFHLPSVLPHEF
jgi:RNA polymerase sigma-70 factor, ECF subfamily